jgi:SOS-response transcriptional repressor LexA
MNAQPAVLEDQQQRILECIRDFIQERGYPPTVRDIARELGISSTSVVDYHLKRLEQAGVDRTGPSLFPGHPSHSGRCARVGTRRDCLCSPPG